MYVNDTIAMNVPSSFLMRLNDPITSQTNTHTRIPLPFSTYSQSLSQTQSLGMSFFVVAKTSNIILNKYKI